MYKSLFILFFSCQTCFSVNAQQIEAFSGVNHSRLFRNGGSNDGYSLKYDNASTDFTAGLAVDSIMLDWLAFRIDIAYNQYSGGYDYNAGGHGGDQYYDLHFKKSTLSFVFYPIQFDIYKRVRINLGLSYAFLIQESFHGNYFQSVYSSTPPPPPPTSYEMNEKYNRVSEKTTFGVQLGIAYPISIGETWIIRPQYNLYIGLNDELDVAPTRNSVFRNFVGIGVSRNLRK